MFKLIGPALVNQDLSEAKGNVEKRIEYIRYREDPDYLRILIVLNISLSYFLFHCYSGELKRKDDLLASMDKKQDEAREKMQEVTILLIIHLFCKNYIL